MECMNCIGNGCLNCQGYDGPDRVARGEGPDTLSPEEIRAAKEDALARGITIWYANQIEFSITKFNWTEFNWIA